MDMNFSPELSLDSPIYFGIEEELMEQQVDDCIDYLRDNYDDEISSDEMSDVLDEFDISYMDLPAYLVKRLDDAIEVY